MSVACAVCDEPLRSKSSVYCPNCRSAKELIQRTATLMMQLHGLPPASGLCVECLTAPATCRDHRYYARPLDVDNVCGGCNAKRGAALDLDELISVHRGLRRASPALSMPSEFPSNLSKHMEAYERRIIERAIAHCHHNQTATARLLGLTFRALRYRIERLGISFK